MRHLSTEGLLISKMKRFTTLGSPHLDELLGGGLRRGTTCLLEEMQGESSGVSSNAGFSFLLSGIQRGDGGIFLLTEHTVNEYRSYSEMKQLISLAKPKQLIFMDALSSMTFGEPILAQAGQNEEIVFCSNVRYLPKFYEEFRNTVRSFERPLMYIDSLSVLLHAMESDKVAWQFWLSLLPLIRHRGLIIVSSFYPQMHSSSFIESIERISDTIIRFTASTAKFGEKRAQYIQVIKNRGLDFDNRQYPFKLDNFQFKINKST